MQPVHTPKAQVRQRSLLVASLLAVTLHAFDEMSVVTVLPVITSELNGRALYGAVFFAYLLVSLIGLVIAGGLASRKGPATSFAWGLLAFAFGLAIAAGAPCMAWLIGGRAIQGLGGGMISATVLVVINRGFTPEERPRVMALNASAWVIPALVAPAAAGAITDFASWRWVFGGLLPLVGVAAWLGVPAMREIPVTSDPAEDPAARGFRDELLDGIRMATGLGAILTALARPLGALEVAFYAFGAAVAWKPLLRVMPPGLLRLRPVLPAAVGAKLFLVFAFFGTEAFVPLALIEIHGTTPTLAGLALTGAALAWTAGAQIQSRLAGAVSAQVLGGLGSVAIGIGIGAMMGLLDPDAPLGLAFASWSLAGFGMGVAYNTVTLSAMAHTQAGEEGVASTALGLTDALGVSLATGFGGAVIAAADRSGGATAEALWPVWLVMTAFAVFAGLASLRLGTASTGEPPVADAIGDGVGQG